MGTPPAKDAATAECDRITESDRLRACLTEYSECMSSYRHTYQTIWQVGSFFAAISAGLFALSSGEGDVTWASLLSPVPLLMWYAGIFIPMDAYGESRAARLREIEQSISDKWKIELTHYREMSDAKRIRRWPRWRVKTAVAIFSFVLLIAWAVLIVRFIQGNAGA